MSKILKIAIALVVAIFSISAFSAWAETIYLPLLKNDPTPTLTPSPTATKSPTPKPGVEIIDIEYASQNPQEEYVEIENKGSDGVDMEDWRITSERLGKLYTFPSFTLGEDKTVRVYSGVGTDSSNRLYMGYSEEVWSGNSDCAYLKDSDKVVDKYCYPQ